MSTYMVVSEDAQILVSQSGDYALMSYESVDNAMVHLHLSRVDGGFEGQMIVIGMDGEVIEQTEPELVYDGHDMDECIQALCAFIFIGE